LKWLSAECADVIGWDLSQNCHDRVIDGVDLWKTLWKTSIEVFRPHGTVEDPQLMGIFFATHQPRSTVCTEPVE
jgi:hypothetical protein